MHNNEKILKFKSELIIFEKHKVEFLKENEELIISLYKRIVKLNDCATYNELKKIIKSPISIDAKYSCFRFDESKVKIIIVLDQMDFLQSVSIDIDLLIDDSPLVKREANIKI